MSPLTNMFQRFPKPDSGPSDGTRYAFKPSLVGGPREFELTSEGLKWQTAAKSGVWAFDKIAAIRLSYRPVSMQSQRFRADIEDTRGDRVTLYSTTWHTVALVSPQDDGYRAFIVELHRRMKEAGSHAYLIAGINPKLYVAGLALIAIVAIAIAGLMLRAVWTREFAGVLFLAGFAALFAWQIGGFMRRNRPRIYTFDNLPMDVLP